MATVPDERAIAEVAPGVYRRLCDLSAEESDQSVMFSEAKGHLYDEITEMLTRIDLDSIPIRRPARRTLARLLKRGAMKDLQLAHRILVTHAGGVTGNG